MLLCASVSHAQTGETKLYHSSNQAAEWAKANSERKEAKLIQEKIASVPQAIWLTGGSLEGFVREAKSAEARNETLLFVTYNVPGRDNGNYSAGGLAGPAAYEKWAEAVASSLGTTKAIAVVEPDAIGLAQNLTDEQKRRERYAMIAKAAAALKKNKNCRVYLDISHWLSPEVAANGLKASGIAVADGFCLNTSAFERTDACIGFGEKVSKLVGNKKFIIDTSRNGNGPWQTGEKDPWCNPPGRALGQAPTFATGQPLVDAYLWIKKPGESDGTCRGGPSAGTFWPEYAYGLAKNAK